jgi:hypothetical protein
MKLIALRGPINTGKSHTINITYQLLLKEGYNQEPGHFRVLGNPVFEDIIDILIKDGVRLGIIGMGDYQRGEGSIAKLIKELVGKKCDIVICACREIPNLEKIISQYPNYIFVDKTKSNGDSNHRVVNGIDAEKIVKLL